MAMMMPVTGGLLSGGCGLVAGLVGLAALRELGLELRLSLRRRAVLVLLLRLRLGLGRAVRVLLRLRLGLGLRGILELLRLGLRHRCGLDGLGLGYRSRLGLRFRLDRFDYRLGLHGLLLGSGLGHRGRLGRRLRLRLRDGLGLGRRRLQGLAARAAKMSAVGIFRATIGTEHLDSLLTCFEL